MNYGNKIKGNDNVFFLTLVDFLAQVLYFGLFIFVVYQGATKKERAEVESNKAGVEKAIKLSGVSNLTELTDQLTKLAPMKLQELSEAINASGGTAETLALLKKVSKEGGSSLAISRLDKLRRIEGSDKPSCLYAGQDRKIVPLATVFAAGRTLTLQKQTPQLGAVLSELRLPYSSVHSLDPGSFQRAFSPLLRLHPQCRYFVKLVERTDLIAPRNAVGSIFYILLR